MTMYFETIKDLAGEQPLTLSVNGACMTGTLSDGGCVQIAKCGLYLPGDVIVYARSDGKLVSHRFLGYVHRGHGWLAITRADQSVESDRPFYVSRILGKVTRVNNNDLSVRPLQRARAVVNYWQTLATWLYRKSLKVFAFSSRNG